MISFGELRKLKGDGDKLARGKGHEGWKRRDKKRSRSKGFEMEG